MSISQSTKTHHWALVSVVLIVGVMALVINHAYDRHQSKQQLTVKVKNDFYQIDVYGEKTNFLAKQQEVYECQLAHQPYTGKPCNTSPASGAVKQHFGIAFLKAKVNNYHQYIAARMQSVMDLNALTPYEGREYARQVDQYGHWITQTEQKNSKLTVGKRDMWHRTFARELGFSLPVSQP